MADVATFGKTRTRCVWVDSDHIYVGTETSRLCLVDRESLKTKTSVKTPFLVSDVARVGNEVFAALGPGRLVCWSDAVLEAEPVVTSVDMNAVKFAVHGTTLFWGTAWGELWERGRGKLASVKTWLSSVTVDDEHIYGGYDDGKCRVFRRDNGKRVKVLDVGGTARCALGEKLYTVDAKSGAFTRWNNFTAEKTFTLDVTGSKYGVIGLHIGSSWIASHTFENLWIHDLDGKLVGVWTPPPLKKPTSHGHDIEDVWLDGETIYVAVHNTLTRLTQKSLRG
jgi:hypothetical protein